MSDKKISQLTAAAPLTGTEQLPLVQGGVTLKASAQNVANLAIPTQTGQSGKYLTTNGSVASWDAINISTADVTGTLPIANGGTGQTSASSAINALLPSQSGQNGKYLTTNGTTASWGTVSGGNPTALISVEFTSPGNMSYVVQYNNTGSTFVLSVLSASGGQLQLNSSLSIINSKTFITMNAFRDAFNFPTFTTAFLCQASVNSPTDSFIQLSNGAGANFNLTNTVTQNPFYLQIVFYP
jgi:hypothetical protein